MEKLKYILGSILIFLFNAFSWATVNSTGGSGGSGAADIDFETVDDGTEDGETIGIPGHMEGIQSASIDMYEGILIGVAVLLIVGYIYYNYTQRSKRSLS